MNRSIGRRRLAPGEKDQELRITGIILGIKYGIYTIHYWAAVLCNMISGVPGLSEELLTRSAETSLLVRHLRRLTRFELYNVRSVNWVGSLIPTVERDSFPGAGMV